MLRLEGYIDLPEHAPGGGFDHAAIHRGLGRIYVAHTANDALDVIDVGAAAYAGSIGGLTGVAGALVSGSGDRVFSSNRGEDTVAIFDPRDPESLVKVPVGVRPNGLAFDDQRATLLVANVGDPADPTAHTVTIVDVERASVVASIPVPGRTRWAIYDSVADAFFVNIADPASIIVLDAAEPTHVARTIAVPAAGPHGLDVDTRGRLYCACDAGRLLVLEPPEYDVVADIGLAGAPDVIFLDRETERLYVAIGDPGLIEVVDVVGERVVETIDTEPGAHTLALDPARHRVYAFLPRTHRAALFAASA